MKPDALICANDFFALHMMAADRLLERIKNPDLPFCSAYVKTTPVLRNSTMR